MYNYVIHQLSSDMMISIIGNGIKKTQTPKKIIIVGAGMAGLVAVSLLKKAGHQITILYIKGIKTRLKIYEQNPEILGFPVAPQENGR